MYWRRGRESFQATLTLSNKRHTNTMIRTTYSFDQFSLTLRDSIDSGWSDRNLTGTEKQQLGTAGPDVGPYEFCPQTDSVADEMDLSVGDLIEWDGRVTQIVSLGTSDARSSDNMQIRVVADARDDNPDTEPYEFDIWTVYTNWRRGNIRLDTSRSQAE